MENKKTDQIPANAESGAPPSGGSSLRTVQWAISILGAASVIAFIVYYPPANELTWEVSRIVFTLFFTPFLMEIFCVIAGFLLVIIWNNRRHAKEAADEWVYLEKVDPNQSEPDQDSQHSENPR